MKLGRKIEYNDIKQNKLKCFQNTLIVMSLAAIYQQSQLSFCFSKHWVSIGRMP